MSLLPLSRPRRPHLPPSPWACAPTFAAGHGLRFRAFCARWELATEPCPVPSDGTLSSPTPPPLPLRRRTAHHCRVAHRRHRGHYVGVHASGFRDFLLKPELLRAIVDCGFEHPSEGVAAPARSERGRVA